MRRRKKKWRATMNETPWSNLAQPREEGEVNARRVDSAGPWDFFWARDHSGDCLLLLWHTEQSRPPKTHLPKLRGMSVVLAWSGDEKGVLVFRLGDQEHRDIFFALCVDIISAANAAKSELSAVQIAIQRTWRWHHLLKGGRDGRLTEQEQKGLIGELHVLNYVLSPTIGVENAVTAWNGPLGDPKDFSTGNVAIESKARRDAGKPFVTIASEYQLESIAAHLFLHVIPVDRAADDQPGAQSLTDVVRSVESQVKAVGVGALEAFDQRLAAAGYREEDDYSGYLWLIGEATIYRVTDNFPRIVSAELPSGVRDVEYKLDLVQCKPFIVMRSELADEITGGGDVVDA